MKLIRCLCLLTILASALPVQATPINDTVIVGSQEWAQVDLFTNVSWNTLNTLCPAGVCASTSVVNGHDLNGWKWASGAQVQDLFNEFTGQANIFPWFFAEAGSTAAAEFLGRFRSTSPSFFQTTEVYGWSSSYITDENQAEGYLPWVDDVTDVFTGVIFSYLVTGNRENPGVEQEFVGAWFVRDASSVPEPTSLALIGLGLASVWVNRRKRGSKV